MTFKKAVFYIVIIVLVAIVIYSFIHSGPKITPPTTTTPLVTTMPVVTNTTMYSCDAGTTITAGFSTSAVHVALSDGRSFDLPQVVSADGAQYTNGTVALITKGDQAFLQENGKTTYDNCIANSDGNAAPVNGMQTFTDQGKTFTFSYPSQFTVSGSGIGYTQSWKTDSDSTLGLILATVSVPQSYQPNTNFGDAKFTVGTSSDPAAVKSCLADTVGNAPTKSTVVINGIKYTKFVSEDAGAGNRYLTTSYRTVQNNQCYAVEYTIHYSVLQNFDPSSGIKGFDQAKVTAALDGIMQSFKFLPQS